VNNKLKVDSSQIPGHFYPGNEDKQMVKIFFQNEFVEIKMMITFAVP